MNKKRTFSKLHFHLMILLELTVFLQNLHLFKTSFFFILFKYIYIYICICTKLDMLFGLKILLNNK